MSAVREALERKTFLKPNREHGPEEHDSNSEFETDCGRGASSASGES
jgi:hypothetical protein